MGLGSNSKNSGILVKISKNLCLSLDFYPKRAVKNGSRVFNNFWNWFGYPKIGGSKLDSGWDSYKKAGSGSSSTKKSESKVRFKIAWLFFNSLNLANKKKSLMAQFF